MIKKYGSTSPKRHARLAGPTSASRSLATPVWRRSLYIGPRYGTGCKVKFDEVVRQCIALSGRRGNGVPDKDGGYGNAVFPSENLPSKTCTSAVGSANKLDRTAGPIIAELPPAALKPAASPSNACTIDVYSWSQRSFPVFVNENGQDMERVTKTTSVDLNGTTIGLGGDAPPVSDVAPISDVAPTYKRGKSNKDH